MRTLQAWSQSSRARRAGNVGRAVRQSQALALRELASESAAVSIKVRSTVRQPGPDTDRNLLRDRRRRDKLQPTESTIPTWVARCDTNDRD